MASSASSRARRVELIERNDETPADTDTDSFTYRQSSNTDTDTDTDSEETIVAQVAEFLESLLLAAPARDHHGDATHLRPVPAAVLLLVDQLGSLDARLYGIEGSDSVLSTRENQWIFAVRAAFLLLSRV